MAEKKASKKKESSGAGRTRNYTAIVYPDSVNTPENWIEVLSDTHIPVMISPLHDQDLNPDGQPKKAHYHVMLCFEGPKTPEQARAVLDQIGAVIPPEHFFKVQSLRGMARYFCHMDNPEKAQYNTELVRTLGGADYVGAIGLVTDKYKAIGEMIDYCVETGVTSYSTLLIYCRKERYDWFRVLCDNGTVVMKEFLKSLDWTMKQS